MIQNLPTSNIDIEQINNFYQFYLKTLKWNILQPTNEFSTNVLFESQTKEKEILQDTK